MTALARTAIGAAWVFAVTNAYAAKTQLACYSEPGTRQTYCIDEANVTANGDVRSAAFYAGGPNEVEKTPYFFVANCAKQITTLQDRQGVNFGGNVSGATPQSRTLTGYLCAAAKPKKDTRLHQF